MKYLQTYNLFESRFDDDYDFNHHNFNCGDCDIYAIALHRIYGYPLYVVNGYFKEDDWDEEGFTEYDREPAHIVVKLPNGNYMDSNGEVTEDELKEDCAFGNNIEYIKIEEITEQEAMHTYSGEDQEEDIQRVMKHITNKEKLSESLINKNINKEDIEDLFVDILDMNFTTEIYFLRYGHRCADNEYKTDYHDGFSVLLKKTQKRNYEYGFDYDGGIEIDGSISLENIYDTLSVAEEYILDVYDKPLTCIHVWYICISNSIRTQSLEKLMEINKNIIRDYDNPLVYQIELIFERQIPKEEPVSKVKKFFNLFKKK